MDALLTILVLVLLSAISGWLKKRGEPEKTEQWPQPPTGPGRSSPPRRPTPGAGPAEHRPSTRSWEEELRRLLEGDPAPAPPQRAPGPAVGRSEPAPPVIAKPLAPPPLLVRTVAETRSPEGPAHDRLDLEGTAAARLRAQRLQQEAAAQLKRAEAMAARRLPRTFLVHKGALSPEIAHARAWFSHPQSARQAVIASVILGPPVGLSSE